MNSQASSCERQPGAEPSHQFEYVEGQLRPAHAELLAAFAEASDRAVVTHQPRLDIAYGPHPRQVMDFFDPGRAPRAVLVYFHAGYWQSRDKSGFRFLAPSLVADGFAVAVVNYPLSPEANVADIVTAARASLRRVAELAPGVPVILAGHSAGAQIAVELAMAGGGDRPRIAGIVSISGVFDLSPLVGTSINAKLGLDPHSAHAASPLHRVEPALPRAVFAVGANETRAFRDQTERMVRAWADAGNPAELVTVADADHFSILTELCRTGGVLRAALGAMAENAAAAVR